MKNKATVIRLCRELNTVLYSDRTEGAKAIVKVERHIREAEGNIENFRHPEEKLNQAVIDYEKTVERVSEERAGLEAEIGTLQGKLKKPWDQYSNKKKGKANPIANHCWELNNQIVSLNHDIEYAEKEMKERQEILDNFSGLMKEAEQRLNNYRQELRQYEYKRDSEAEALKIRIISVLKNDEALLEDTKTLLFIEGLGINERFEGLKSFLGRLIPDKKAEKEEKAYQITYSEVNDGIEINAESLIKALKEGMDGLTLIGEDAAINISGQILKRVIKELKTVGSYEIIFDGTRDNETGGLTFKYGDNYLKFNCFNGSINYLTQINIFAPIVSEEIQKAEEGFIKFPDEVKACMRKQVERDRFMRRKEKAKVRGYDLKMTYDGRCPNLEDDTDRNIQHDNYIEALKGYKRLMAIYGIAKYYQKYMELKYYLPMLVQARKTRREGRRIYADNQAYTQ